MHSRIGASILLALLAAVFGGVARAQGLRQNQPAAVLVFPAIITDEDGPEGGSTETFATVTNTSGNTVRARVTFFEGGSCLPCGLDLVLGPQDSETLVFIREVPSLGEGGEVTLIRRLDASAVTVCPPGNGFATVHQQDDKGFTLYDDVLIGDTVFADYSGNAAASTEALPIQSAGNGDGDPVLRFDGSAFRRLPAELRSDFLAGDFVEQGTSSLAFLNLFTLASGALGDTTCQVTVHDPEGVPLTRPLSFQCWASVELADLDPGFANPLLGFDHGRLRVACSTDTDGDGSPETQGGVHGALIQEAFEGTSLRTADEARVFSDHAAWGRLLAQSSAVGDAVTLDPEPPRPDNLDRSDVRMDDLRERGELRARPRRHPESRSWDGVGAASDR